MIIESPWKRPDLQKLTSISREKDESFEQLINSTFESTSHTSPLIDFNLSKRLSKTLNLPKMNKIRHESQFEDDMTTARSFQSTITTRVKRSETTFAHAKNKENSDNLKKEVSNDEIDLSYIEDLPPVPKPERRPPFKRHYRTTDITARYRISQIEVSPAIKEINHYVPFKEEDVGLCALEEQWETVKYNQEKLLNEKNPAAGTNYPRGPFSEWRDDFLLLLRQEKQFNPYFESEFKPLTTTHKQVDFGCTPLVGKRNSRTIKRLRMSRYYPLDRGVFAL